MTSHNFRTALFIAWRHLFSKKKHSIVNIISIISALGVIFGTAALVIVTSVFNGMEEVVTDSFNSFNPDLKITPKEGKSFLRDAIAINDIRLWDEIHTVEEVVSDMVLLEYDGKQQLIELKGVNRFYPQNCGFDDLLIDGDFRLQHDDCEFGVMGASAAGTLQLNLQSPTLFKLYYPKRLQKNLGNPATAFNTRYLTPCGVFASYTEYDDRYLLCSIDFARNLMNYDNELTSIEIYVKNAKDVDAVQQRLMQTLGEDFFVKNRYQQEELLFKTMKSEKLMIFAILLFILLIAVFNIIGTLAMMIIEKKEDITVLHYLGASYVLIQKIFRLEGMIISFVGGLIGMLLGALICWGQQTFHFISFGNGDTGYVLDYYPVKMMPVDFLIVFLTIFCISLFVSSLPVHHIKRSSL